MFVRELTNPVKPGLTIDDEAERWRFVRFHVVGLAEMA